MLRKMAVIALALSLLLAACGGSSSTDDATNGGSNTTAATRLVTGTIGTPAAAMSLSLPPPKATVADRCSAVAPAICRVIATATDGSTVLDEDLSDCAFSLALAIGQNYVISFVSPDPATDLCTKFVATLVAGGDSVLSIDAGEDIAFGAITIDPVTGQATFTGSIEELLACEELMQSDMDDDGICDSFEQAVADDLADDDGTDDGDDDGAQLEDIAGTYAMTSIADAMCAGNPDAFAASYAVAVDAGLVDLTDAADATYLFNNDEGLAPTADLTFVETDAGFKIEHLLLDSGCPFYKSYNSIVIDLTATPPTLTRTYDEMIGAGSTPGLLHCVGTYTKQP